VEQGINTQIYTIFAVSYIRNTIKTVLYITFTNENFIDRAKGVCI